MVPFNEIWIFVQVGGVEEYQLVEAMKNGTVNKPVIAWCIGTCAKMFTSEVRISISYFPFAHNLSQYTARHSTYFVTVRNVSQPVALIFWCISLTILCDSTLPSYHRNQSFESLGIGSHNEQPSGSLWSIGTNMLPSFFLYCAFQFLENIYMKFNLREF